MQFRSGTLTVLVAVSAFLAMGCTGPSSLNWTITDDIDYGHLNMDIDESKLNDSNRALGVAIKAKKTVDFKEVTRAWVSQHTKSFNEQHSRGEEAVAVLSQINQISQGLNGDAFRVKTTLDSKMDQVTGKSWRYNKDEASIVARLKDNKSQCYSGTVMFDLVNRVKGRTQYLRSNPVTIFTSGHVLPGIVTQERNGQKKLTGIETTVKGRGEIVMGLTSEVNESRRVVLSEDFAIIEILKDAIKNSSAVVQAAEKEAEKRHGIKSQAPAVAAASAGQGEGGSQAQGAADRVLNASPFAFGSTAHIPTGDQVPETVDRRDLSRQSTRIGESAPSSVPMAVMETQMAQRVSRNQVERDEQVIRRLVEVGRGQSLEVELANLNDRVIENLLVRGQDERPSYIYLLITETPEQLCNAFRGSAEAIFMTDDDKLDFVSGFCEATGNQSGYGVDRTVYVAQLSAARESTVRRPRRGETQEAVVERSVRVALTHTLVFAEQSEVQSQTIQDSSSLTLNGEAADRETLTTLFGRNVIRAQGLRIYRVRVTTSQNTPI